MSKSRDLADLPVGGGDINVDGGVYLGGTGAANYLDDYEEGTWTPVVKIGGTTESASIRFARYTKVGNSVTLFYRIIIDTVTGTGALTIEGMPFATNSDGDNFAAHPCFANRIEFGGGDYLTLGYGPSSTTLVLSAVRNSTAASSISIDNADLSAGFSQVRGSFTYMI